MTKRQFLVMNILLILIGLILLFELIRDSMRAGDFIGYVNAGNLVLSNKNIYSDYLNTWPPFFSVFSVILAIGDMLSSFFIRFLWLLGSIISMYYVIRVTIKMSLNKTLNLNGNSDGIILQEPIVVIPLLVMLRFLMDNLANVQINIYMLLCASLSIVFFIKKKYILVGLLLGLSISLKVYTIFFLFYFLFKREFKPVFWTLLFILFINSISFLVFGFDQAIEYYQQWYSEIANSSIIAHHKNQSVFGLFLRLFSTENPGNNMSVNILDLKPHIVKLITYGAIILASIFPAFLFRKKLTNRNSLRSILEYSFIFTAIPILSPLSWKAYFIFLWLPYFLIYVILFRVNTNLNRTRLIQLKCLFWFSIVLNVFSTEAIVGVYFSDVLEAYSSITIGTVMLLVIQILIINNIERFDLSTINYQTLPNKK